MAGPAKPPPVKTARGPSKPASNPLMSQAKALANAAVNPTISAIKGQIGQNNTQTSNALGQVGGFYNQLGAQAGQGVTDERGIADALNAQLKGIGAGEQSQLHGIGDSALSSLAKYTPAGATGLNAAASGSLATQIARQQGLAAQDQGAAQRFGALQGANYQGLAASNLGTFAKAGQEGLTNIAQAGQVRNEPLENRLASAIATRGADVETAYGKLQQQQQTDQIARAGLGIKQFEAGTGRINAQTSRINANTRQQVLRFDKSLTVGSPAWERVQTAHGKAWSSNPNAVGSPAWGRVQTANRAAAKSGTGSTGGGKPLTPNENNTWFSKLSTVGALIQDGQKHGESGSSIINSLLTGNTVGHTKYDRFMVHVAYELMKSGGYISPQTAAIMHRQYGLRGGTWNGKPIQVANIGNTLPGTPGLNPGSTRGHG